MRNYNFLKIFLLLILGSYFFIPIIARADDCLELTPILEKYYEAGQAEDIDAYMKVIDQEYVREHLLDNYEDYVKSAWEVYDTESFEMKVYNCKIEDSVALIYLNLKSFLSSEGEVVEIQRNYVGLLNKSDDWKIRYILDEDVFSQFQSSLYSQLFLDATKDLIYNELDKAEQVLENVELTEQILAKNLSNQVTEGENPSQSSLEKKKGPRSYILFIIVLIVAGTLRFYFKKVKK